MDPSEQAAFELIEAWYGAHPGIIARGITRDTLIASVAAALRQAEARGIERAAEVADGYAAQVWPAAGGVIAAAIRALLD